MTDGVPTAPWESALGGGTRTCLALAVSPRQSYKQARNTCRVASAQAETISTRDGPNDTHEAVVLPRLVDPLVGQKR